MSNNPWQEISLSDYENHMSLDSVRQLQSMNNTMKSQFDSYDVKIVMILGIAGGNGLEHVNTGKFGKVYGVDINEDYLQVVGDRYNSLDGILECLCIDLIKEAEKLPRAELLIANLLIEYIGYEVFGNVVKAVNPKYVSAVIQINTDEINWVSDSPYIHAFDRLDEVHHRVSEKGLNETMAESGYRPIFKEADMLPSGKALLRLDYTEINN
ncbi:MAG: methyltransferase type 11 [Clostridia bacterium]|nr:methyltransferase type 11 [Clostridia bacterium]